MTKTSVLRIGTIIAALAFAMLAPMSVLAHAALDEPTPADGATIEGQPASIEGTSTQDMEVDGSSIELRDADGTTVATGGVDPDDPRRMVIDPVPELSPGTYEVRWTTLSAEDGELDRDTWTFTVIAAPTPEPTPAPTPTPEPSATASPSATPAPTATPAATPSPAPSASAPPDDGAAGSGSDVILPIVVGLAIVVVGGGVLLSRRGRAS
jgi:methionine-rich copper-binding protein CopC